MFRLSPRITRTLGAALALSLSAGAASVSAASNHPDAERHERHARHARGAAAPTVVQVLGDSSANHVSSWSDGTNKVTVRTEGAGIKAEFNGKQVIELGSLEVGRAEYSEGANTLIVTAEDGAVTATLNGETVVSFDTLDSGHAHAWAGDEDAVRDARRSARRMVEKLRLGMEADQGQRQSRLIDRLRGAGAMGFAGQQMPRVMIGVTMLSGDEADELPESADPRKITVISSVIEGLPADVAGLQKNDIIVGINGSDDASPEAVRRSIKEKNAGESLAIKILRRDENGAYTPKELTLNLAAYDADALGTPQAWAFSSGGANPGRFEESTRRIEELGSELRDLSAELKAIGERVHEAESAKIREELGAQMRDLGERMRLISEQMAEAAGGMDFALELFGDLGSGGAMNLPRLWLEGPRGPALVVPPAPPVPPAAPTAPAPAAAPIPEPDSRLERLDSRLERLERMIERLAEQQEREAPRSGDRAKEN